MHKNISKNNFTISPAMRTSMVGGLLVMSLPLASLADNQAQNNSALLVTSSFYTGTVTPIVPGVTQLPGTNATNKVAAIADSSYPNVFLNNTVDGSFGITSPIYVSILNGNNGKVVGNYNLTRTAAKQGVDFVTSFSSKSELAVHQSTDGKSVTLMGYNAVSGLLDISNSNTPGLIDATNPTTGFAVPTYRSVAQIDFDGGLLVTNSNAYSGNNGRSAILDSATNTYFLAGNAGNSGKPAPNGAFLGLLSDDTGVQSIVAGSSSPDTMVVGLAQGVSGSTTGYQHGFSVAEINPQTGLPYGPADKTGKDDNFRGQIVFNNTLYVTKGSGGNGINTVYQVGDIGGIDNLDGNSMISILPGLPTGLASGTNYFPFGIWFANDHTLYVADEGDGVLADAGDATKNANAGLEKWVLESDGLWHNVYTLQDGLNLGVNYTVTGALNGVSGSYTAATAGLRNLTGRVNGDGTVTLYAITSTVSTSGDQGADPNKLVTITDKISALGLPANETFSTLKTAAYGQVLRGVTTLGKTCSGQTSGNGSVTNQTPCMHRLGIPE
jgi:hypothetical protein